MPGGGLWRQTLMMTQPRIWAERIEQTANVPDGDAERFAGYGIMAQPFTSGHMLALRRWPATTLSRPYTSVWHRSPQEQWTFYSDAPARQSCPRYFSTAVEHTVQTPIELEWESDSVLRVRIAGDVGLDWRMALESNPLTGALNAMSRVLPEPLWRQRWFLASMGLMAGLALSAGRMRLHGRVPNGQWFQANPQLIWMVRDSSASLGGHDFGAIGPLARQANLADVWMPQRGIFATARSFMEPYDAARHALPLAPDSNSIRAGVAAHGLA